MGGVGAVELWTRARARARVGRLGRAVKVVGDTKKVAKPVEAKYRGPNGESWSGRGLMPKWMKALVTEGKSKQDFAV